MCGRYTLMLAQDELEDRFGARFASDGEQFSPRYNMAPSQDLPVITDETPTTIRELEWGLVPTWADDASGGIINARAETVNEKPSFRDAYRQATVADAESAAMEQDANDRETPAAGRCLVPADGFYEWVETDDGKHPYRVAFEDDRPFALAGLWVRRERPQDETTQTGLDAFGGGAAESDTDGADPGPLETFTIITTEPNDLVVDLHHRMAVILDPADEQQWLSGGDPADLLAPHPAAEMRAYPVSTAVNDPSVDSPSLVEPLSP
ncbi:SOS response-associated peptidase [Natrialba chahannaoensis]|nr:SOS response-associated peptidase [Natrialba chahannaoensis]